MKRSKKTVAIAAVAIVATLVSAVVAYSQLRGNERSRGVSLTQSSADRAAQDSALSKAVWVFLDAGSTNILTAPAVPALRFSPGTSYAQAVTKLYVSVASEGRLPAEATTVPALPRPVVFACRADGSVELSLLAPFGYDIDQLIRPPSYSLPGHLEPTQVSRAIAEAQAAGRALPDGASVDVPPLRSSQVINETGGAPCR